MCISVGAAALYAHPAGVHAGVCGGDALVYAADTVNITQSRST